MNKKTVTVLLCSAWGLAACGGPTPPNWERITAACAAPPPATPAPDAAAGEAVAPAADGATPPAETNAGPAVASCTGRVFYLDTANITKQGGVIYVTMRTTSQDAADAGFGVIRAEANCARKRLEPSALKEDVYDAAGKLVESARLAVITSEDQAQVLQKACAS
jgi:hypothetical protein